MRPPSPEFEIPARQVKTEKATRRLFVACPACKTPSYIGPYGAAHLYVCDLFSTCEGCGAKLTISRGIP